ncbi:MAG: ATP-binding protein [Proteobacteria bacterium]|nr:ATP-binding protein [Pseudomonadota bacterium]
MPPYALIPLLACVVSAALASANIVRDPRGRVSWLIGGVLVVAAVWSLLIVLWCAAPTPEAALPAMRAVGFAYLWLGPLCLDLIMQVRPSLSPRLHNARTLAYLLTPVLAMVHASTPWFIESAVATEWGYVYRFGPAFPLAYLFAAFWPALAVGVLIRTQAGGSELEGISGQGPILSLAVAGPLLVVTVTDALLPLLEIPFPLLGTASIAGLGGVIWIWAYRLGLTAFTAAGFAREILETLPEGVALLRGQDTIRSINGTLSRLTETPPAALIGGSLGDLLVDPRPADSGEYEALLRGRSGRTIPVSVTDIQLQDRRGSTTGRVAVLRDQRRVVELRRQLVTAAQHAAVGEMAAGIAHEVNNPIAFILANLNLLEQHLEHLGQKLAGESSADGPLDRSRSCIQAANGAVGRVAGIVREVRGFAHKGSGEPELVDVTQLVESAVRLAMPRLRGRVEVSRDYRPVPLIPAAAQDLKHAFLSVLVSSAASCGGSGTLHIRSAATPCCIEVDVEVRHQGPGLSEDALARIFDPLLHPSDAGDVGFGLAMAYHVVRDQGGRIAVESRRPSVLCVRIELPVPEDEEAT